MVVAPRAGAWIETKSYNPCNATWQVAPRAGAWIETSLAMQMLLKYWVSPPVRGRGLKLYNADVVSQEIGRPPCGGVD